MLKGKTNKNAKVQQDKDGAAVHTKPPCRCSVFFFLRLESVLKMEQQNDVFI